MLILVGDFGGGVGCLVCGGGCLELRFDLVFGVVTSALRLVTVWFDLCMVRCIASVVFLLWAAWCAESSGSLLLLIVGGLFCLGGYLFASWDFGFAVSAIRCC